MLFNSAAYLFLMSSTFVLFYLLRTSFLQTLVLIVASFVFYGWSQPELLVLLVYSILVNTFCTFFINRFRTKAKFWMIIGVGLNLATLLLFKYAGLIIRTLGIPSDSGGLPGVLAHLPLPIGISFFTFQGISLIVDIYKDHSQVGSFEPQKLPFWKHLYKTTLFKAFFPQLVAGPIVKAHDFYYQIRLKHIKDVNFESALKKIVLGYFLKCVVADNLKDQTFWLYYPYFKGLSSVELMTLLFGYSFQIFSDFAGYSYIAIGCSELFGYRLKANFNWPYISQSFSEFWTRWHISLSSFLKEYLYLPLGGNRKGEVRTYLNLFIVMFLGGLWHGAAWSYAIWGSVHGMLLAVERALGWNRPSTEGALKYPRMILVFTVVSLVWLFFKLPDISHVVSFVESVVQNGTVPIIKSRVMITFIFCLAPLMMHIMKLLPQEKLQKSLRFDYAYFAIMFFLILTSRGSAGEFIYFQF